MEPKLWAKVFDDANPYKQQLIDHVVSTTLPENKSLE
jgi:hypothetical protein